MSMSSGYIESRSVISSISSNSFVCGSGWDGSSGVSISLIRFSDMSTGSGLVSSIRVSTFSTHKPENKKKIPYWRFTKKTPYWNKYFWYYVL